jgi:hypothetical protein
MTQTLFTDSIPTVALTSTLKAKSTIPSNSEKFEKELRWVIAKLERQDIGWLDILSAMANIAEQRGEEQVSEVLDAAAKQLKRNRKTRRNL